MLLTARRTASALGRAPSALPRSTLLRPVTYFSAGAKDAAAASSPSPSAPKSGKPPPIQLPSANRLSARPFQDLNDLPVTFADISRAQVAIRGGVTRTSCEKSEFLSDIVGANVYLKPEFRQFTGSFKERGARNALLSLLREGGPEFVSNGGGAIAASAGNHALALAYHGRQLGVPVTVVMPTVAPLAKVDKCRRFGARIIIEGAHIGEAKEYAETLVASEGLSYINGYDDPPIVAGAGTIGIEIVEDVPDVDAVVVPVGGAGLIAGISCAIKTLKPECQVYGVEPERAASYIEALAVGEPVFTHMEATLADGLAVPSVGPHAFEVARHYVDETVTCSEKEIALAVLRLIENEKVVVEGGGAAGLAALLPKGNLDRGSLKGKNVVVPLCGGNIDTTTLGRVLDRGLAADDRLCRFVATVSDRPGGIARLTDLLHQHGASIKDVMHERAWLHSSVDQVQVKVVVELQGKDHAERVKNALVAAEYPLLWNLDLDEAKDLPCIAG
mmetsp:Transcript_8809/g.18072  ORF Transcript_8809/g.18072 Transcript_8809/m.18072 type:complete len:502 (-) Transcript_8809:229-1734(-)|eukprot:CAMPEP_0194322772 /NCGR_PEP_ID=MMETSP0171-20130528/22268_1 /TAXON_ID=218684 /ORGANISM="Corethron pennatum, Strain L29A3" /LENGTH=501 /DNA_ID=CAMNT_0039081145 /DNA_START=116 /DNA_END=1621 /DNA_ORIENTATION=-